MISMLVGGTRLAEEVIMKKLSLMAFVFGLCFAGFAGSNTASALTCSQQCYAAWNACMLDGHTSKQQCNLQKSECLYECP